MSGSSDTSQPSDRSAFCAAILGGGPGGGLPARAQAVANCQLRLPVDCAFMLGMADTATYAQAAALLQMRWSSGQAGY
ncbi:hypothetical protein HN018_02865 [Lichenicola cladoniae]|uniref:Uncharacterized protein n=1 Tax=Lichenicola cladoniae TaxID=1484109 RepID=A0A6M8HLA8_9PROT|nr:hypothetical protein [Lichenicola cladoniae]NPD68923.1 hypothetical protein [Acetobacteraceae bacterium]QKE89131.1 hypothetical protein HN018_02865 [Lichenicola cladoniae]